MAREVPDFGILLGLAYQGFVEKLNAHLEAERKKTGTSKVVADLQKIGLQTLKKYGDHCAVGAAMLTMGSLFTLISNLGGGDIVGYTFAWMALKKKH